MIITEIKIMYYKTESGMSHTKIGEKIMHKIRNTIIILVGSILAGALVLFLVHLLPLSPMKEHIRQSLPLLEAEFENSELIMGYDGTLTGSFTDCLMLENAVYTSSQHSIWEQSMMMYRGESLQEGWAPGVSLVQYIQEGSNPREVEYSRYWHGYLIILKPLLLFFNVGTIRMLNAILQYALPLIFLFVCTKKGRPYLGIAMCVALPFLYSFSMYASLSLSICFYVMILAAILQVLYERKLRSCWWEFFVIIGILTAYFDFLTYPLVTLGACLCIMSTLENKQWKRACWSVIEKSLAWGIGYLGMWAGKWVLTDLFFQSGTLTDALNTVKSRTDTVQQSVAVGFLEVIRKNLGEFLNWPFVLLIIVTAGGIIIYLSKQKMDGKRWEWLGCLPYLIIAAYPFCWYLVTQNHSYEHFMFTCKIMFVSVFAFICFGINFCTIKNKDKW